ncbi:hypothetical protein [Gimesia sp.]|uniref:hypothetical protein n=1 Tax=Gimesia sp. TaxID=2024833 RepID=UPI000C628F74|nr:hypothetical protein [Gimesia sp.]MAX35163.1 hypothetical protein [Gimesia sp.]HAH47973.1 hypothetical protein [Planctomycetaceae bacterium]HBL47591.1 hypothetical protein [Planctomycetaceae bacterium]|tara:strand:- start:19158 stop:20345 length:1188 start_codon:yes stop_codon:yes gene_type:complete
MQSSDNAQNQKDSFDFIRFIRPLILSLESIKREPFQLRSLSIPMRWEVTRRHPFYQRLWKDSADFYRKETISTNPFEQLKRESAVELLALIGISGEPPDPSTPFSKLGESELNKAWLSGAVHPITLRGMAGILLATLPESTLGELGLYLIEASGEKNDKEKQSRDKSLSKLISYKCDALDSFPDEPLVSVNPAASQRLISEAIKDLHAQWKNKRELKEQRDRSDKNIKYLDVWDLREGFSNEGTYDVSQERTFKEIAKEQSSPLTTVSNHYRSAFELIIGKPYSPELWWNTMGVFKLNLFNFEHSVVSQLRPRKSRTPRPVPESILGAEIDFLNQVTRTDEYELTYVELMAELKSFIGQGLSDKEIHERLGVETENPVLIETLTWMRSRTSEIEK